MTSDLQITADEIEHILPNNLQLYTEIDNIWIISHALELPDIPMYPHWLMVLTVRFMILKLANNTYLI